MRIFPRLLIEIGWLNFAEIRCALFGHKWCCKNPDIAGLKTFRCKRCGEVGW